MTLYVFDSSSLRVLRNYYPRHFPTFWKHFDAAVQTGSVISVREVYNELEDLLGDHWLWGWASAHREIFVTPTADDTAFVADIFAVVHFCTLVGERQRLQGKPVADPFVVAVARTREGRVVTEESLRENAAKIPNVCRHFDIPCINMEGFLGENGLAF